jgi:hypothetical protein
MSLEKNFVTALKKNPRFISFAGARESPWYGIYKKKSRALIM